MSELRVGGSNTKRGYKRTVLGEIPDQWRIVTIHEACDLVVDCKNRTPPFIEASDFAVVRTPNVRNGQFVLDDLLFTDEASYREWTARAVPQAGDIILTREAPLGEVCAVPIDRKVCLGQRMMLLRPSKTALNSDYMRFALQSTPVRKNLMSKVGGSTVGHAKVDDVRFLELPLPSLPEQQAIAAALSDVDALIGALDRLIAKKSDINQAAMQQLLTGQTRLPGFSGAWRTSRLRDLCRSIVDGTHFTPAYVNIGVPFYSVENVSADNFTRPKFISEAAHKTLTTRCKPERGDILLTRIGSIGATKLIDWNVNASIYVSLALLKVSPEISADFLYRYTKCRKFVADLEDRSLLNAAPKKINMGEIGEVPIPVPTRAEQEVLARALSDMDAELITLKNRRDKTRELKQGMMQELLTGRIRLV